MNTTDGTAERVKNMTADAEKWIGKVYRKIEKAEARNDYDKADELRQEIDSYGHSVKRVVTITLAGGGPSHWLEVTLDDDGDVESVESIASWASAPKRTRVYPGAALWRYAEDQTSHYGSAEGEL